MLDVFLGQAQNQHFRPSVQPYGIILPMGVIAVIADQIRSENGLSCDYHTGNVLRYGLCASAVGTRAETRY
jgi:hypothetical protein